MTEQLDENKLIAERRAKLEHYRETGPANGHPNTFRRTHKAGELEAQFGDKSKEEIRGPWFSCRYCRSGDGQTWSVHGAAGRFWSHPGLRR